MLLSWHGYQQEEEEEEDEDQQHDIDLCTKLVIFQRLVLSTAIAIQSIIPHVLKITYLLTHFKLIV